MLCQTSLNFPPASKLNRNCSHFSRTSCSRFPAIQNQSKNWMHVAHHLQRAILFITCILSMPCAVSNPGPDHYGKAHKNFTRDSGIKKKHGRKIKKKTSTLLGFTL